MAKLGESFRDFELGGWEDESVCSDYDEHLSTVTIQSVGALLDAAGVRQGRRVLDVATAPVTPLPLPLSEVRKRSEWLSLPHS